MQQRDTSTPGEILPVKTSLDGHWRGLSMVALALRKAGCEVILGGMATADEVVSVAIQEDVDAVGLNTRGRVEIAIRIVDTLRSAGLSDVPIVAGGVLAPQAVARLDKLGVPAFPPGSSLDKIVATVDQLLSERKRSAQLRRGRQTVDA